jgi:hypothetical protein
MLSLELLKTFPFDVFQSTSSPRSRQAMQKTYKGYMLYMLKSQSINQTIKSMSISEKITVDGARTRLIEAVLLQFVRCLLEAFSTILSNRKGPHGVRIKYFAQTIFTSPRVIQTYSAVELPLAHTHNNKGFPGDALATYLHWFIFESGGGEIRRWRPTEVSAFR